MKPFDTLLVVLPCLVAACDAGAVAAPTFSFDAAVEPEETAATAHDAAADAAPLCPDDLPQSCPSPIPSYKTDVAPIFASRCTLCHSATGIVPNFPETSYADVYGQRSPILDQVNMCTMPPLHYPELTIPERLTLLSWLVCNAPNN